MIVKILIASDQAGFPLKEFVCQYLAAKGVQVMDAGPASPDRQVDYPDYASAVTRGIVSGQYDRGILICGTGLGMSISANRIRGVRAALCHDVYTAHQSRAHNDANVLCMGAWVVTPQRAEGILDEWLRTEYEGGRHVPRLVKIDQLAQVEDSVRAVSIVPAAGQFRLTASLSPKKSVFGPLLFAGQLEDGIHAAAQAGFDAVELSIRRPEDIDIPEIQKLLEENGLCVSAIATGQSYLHDQLSFCHPDPKVRTACVERIQSLVPVAGAFDAALILGGIRGRFVGDPATWPSNREATIEAMRQVVRHAAVKGVRVLIEPINRYETNFINTAEEGLAVIDALGDSPTQLLLDTFHMNLEEPDIPAAILQSGKYVGYVHAADSNRRAPGQGHTNFADVLRTLVGIGYRGFIGAEILPLPDDETAIFQAGAFLKALVGSARLTVTRS